MSAGPEEFVGEEMTPVPATGDAVAMARGEPGLPRCFTWRGVEYAVAGVIRQWKTTGPCRSGGGEVYLRKHWFRVLTRPEAIMTIYCQRQAQNRRRPKSRWWIYTIERDTAADND